MNLRVGGILPFSVVDGKGIRATIFVAGCSHHCPGCHNEEIQSPDAGTLMSVSEATQNLISAVSKHHKGITFSGGEPMERPHALTLLAKKLRLQGIANIWVYSGYTFEQIQQDPEKVKLLAQCDVLVDGRFVMAKKDISLAFRGSSNQRIIDVSASIGAGRAVEIVLDSQRTA